MYKTIGEMFQLIKGSIIDKELWPNRKIDTIVNAAKPTLMGSTQGVDGALHAAVDNYLSNNPSEDLFNTFNKNICRTLGTSEYDKQIRCERGHAITTPGYRFCNFIIHAVGTKYDGPLNPEGLPVKKKHCSSSCINTLESCYYAIIEEVKKHPDIETVGIPIIGAGEYKFPFELAAKIAIASIGNALIEWKKQDEEMFEMSNLRKILLFVYDSDTTKCDENFITSEDIFNEYRTYFNADEKVTFQSSWQAHFRYLKDLSLYDKKRGYFSIARKLRWLLMAIRTVFLPISLIKDLKGNVNWEKRRWWVEITVLGKVLMPVLFYIILHTTGVACYNVAKPLFVTLVIYLMSDTLTYLLALICFADIQRPSANIIRSLIMLFVNYIEIALDLAFLYYYYYKDLPDMFNIRIREALTFGFLGESALPCYCSVMDYVFLYLDTGVKFFFLTMVFGYFFNHIRQRKFRS